MVELYEFGAFRLDAQERRLTRAGASVHLEPRPFDLLRYLLEHAGMLVSKQQLIDSVWARAVVSDNALTRSIHQVRAALGDDADKPVFIETVPGSGYRFIAPVTRVDAAAADAAATGVRPRLRMAPAAVGLLLVAVLAGILLWTGEGSLDSSPREVDRIAVLPLENFTGDDEQEYLVQGIHEELIAALSRIAAIDVISRTSVTAYGDSAVPIPEIARALEVDALIEGSVMRDGDSLYVTAQLIAAEPERHLWSRRFEMPADDVFELAPQIAQAIAAELGQATEPVADGLLASMRTPDPRAYDSFLRARFHYERKTPADYERAQQFYRQAIEIDPDFAAAYEGLAHSYGSAAVWGIRDPSVVMPMVQSLGEQALALDDTSAEARLLIAGIRFYWDWDLDAARRAVERVLERNPNSARAFRLLAEILSVAGRKQESLTAIERARELDPLSPTAQLKPAFNRYLVGDYQEAIEIGRAGLEFYPGFWQGHWVVCLSLAALERHAEAVAECEAAVAYSDGASVALGGLGYAYARAGRVDEAREVIADLEARRRETYVGAANLAIIHGALGELDRAFTELERAYANRDWLLVHVNNEAFFDPLRGDPRFKAFAAQSMPH